MPTRYLKQRRRVLLRLGVARLTAEVPLLHGLATEETAVLHRPEMESGEYCSENMG